MKFQLVVPDGLMWPGKPGIVASNGQRQQFGLDEWEGVVGRSKQLVTVPSGKQNERATFIFASEQGFGRMELVYQHGYIWPVDPPRSGKAIMDERIEHLNNLENGI